MMTSLILASLAMAPMQPPAVGELKLTKVRPTYGILGATRAIGKMLPGDVLFIAFDIEGITVGGDGKAQYTMAMEVLDTKDKSSVYKQDPADRTDMVPLGGNKLPARAFVTIGLDQPPGNYAMRVTVTDQVSKKTQTLEQQFEVLPKDFGIVAVYASVDERGKQPASTIGVVGNSVFIHFAAVGFDRDGTTKQPNLHFEMIPLTEKGEPTLTKPTMFDVTSGVDEADPVYTVRFLLPMTREGKFTLRLKATDNITKKTSTFDLPLTVISAE